MVFRRVLFGACVLSLAVSGCGFQPEPATAPILDKLPNDMGKSQSQVQYLTRFSDAERAQDHAEAVRNRGGRATAIGKGGRVWKITASRAQLDGLEVPTETLANLNSKVRVTAQPEGREPPVADSHSAADPVEAFLTARDVVGVTELVERFPKADGRNQKVAIFDTGIEFGLPGVSKTPEGEQKLVGFYDFTDFGRVEPERLDTEEPRESYDIDDEKLSFGESLEPRKVQSVGILSERELAKDYLTEPKNVDLDGDGKAKSKFPYAVGVGRDGRPAVWIDLNKDGVINDRAAEELTNYNTTYKTVPVLPERSADGARPLAVTIGGPEDVQFHMVLRGHGTSCAIIVAGKRFAEGRLRGMAPEAKLLSYSLDVTGQDIYKMEDLVEMFTHARDQGASAISISWGLTTADLASARFLSGFLDREIASEGVMIGFAAGNNGPGVASATKTDYIPHDGFGVGAHISKAQARNVYGWVGYEGESTIFYSSFGPSEGGRQVPDVVSPLMSLVRGTRKPKGPHFKAFGGTSSATPALIGGVTALRSAIEQYSSRKIYPRLLKLAVKNTAHKVEGNRAVRQGEGLIDVAAAYDVYQRLAKRYEAAQEDAPRASEFPYDLRAETTLPGKSQKGEGFYFRSFQSSASLKIKLTEESKKLVDRGSFTDFLAIEHSGELFSTPDAVTLQRQGGELTLSFDPALKNEPGVHSDLIRLKNRNGTTLLWVPVVVEIPARPDAARQLTRIEDSLEPFDVWRKPLELQEKSQLHLQGLIQAQEPTQDGLVGFVVYGKNGNKKFTKYVSFKRRTNSFDFKTKALPAGQYELVAYQYYPRGGAALRTVDLAGAVSLPKTRVVGTRKTEKSVSVALSPLTSQRWSKAKLEIKSQEKDVVLERGRLQNRKGYVGQLSLEKPVKKLSWVLYQDPYFAKVETLQSMELVLLNKESGTPVHRGWADLEDGQSPLHGLKLFEETAKFSILAFPNVVKWEKVETPSVTLRLAVPFKKPFTSKHEFEEPKKVRKGSLAKLNFKVSLPELSTPVRGKLKLFDANGDEIETLPVRL